MTIATGILFSDPQARPLSNLGAVQAGVYLCFFLTGTTTPTNVYSDGLLTTPLSQPTPGSVNPTGGTVANSAGLFVPIYLNPATIYRVQMYTAAGVKIEDTDPYVPQPIPTPTAAQVGAALYPETAGETAAAVTIVNYQYPPYCVDRYVTNSIPGTTDCTSAWNQATVAAMNVGGVVTYGATSEYLVTGPINCTVTGGPDVAGITIQGLGNGGQDQTYGILAKHTGVAVFDCTGNDSIVFRDVSIKTDNTTFPQTGILTARNSSGESNYTRLFNVKMNGNFSVACYYNYASEDDVLVGCLFVNGATGAGTKCAVFTATNISSLVSPFTTIATGSHSCIDHNLIGCQFLNSAGTTTSDCIYIEVSDSVKIFGGWAHNAAAASATSTSTSSSSGLMTVGGTVTGTFAVGQQIYGTGVPGGASGVTITSLGSGTGGAGTYNVSNNATFSATSVTAGNAGRALVYVDMTNGASNFGHVTGFTGELAVPLTLWGIYFSDNAATPVGWTIDGCKLTNGGGTIGSGNSSCVLNGFKIGKTPYTGAAQAGGLLVIGSMTSCTIDTGTALTIGTSNNNTIIGDSSTWMITTRSHDNWIDNGTTNATFAPGIANGANDFTTVGTITQTGKFEYTGRRVKFSIKLSAATSVAWTSGATIPTLPGVATDSFSCTVVDATAGTVQGAGVITAGSGASTITLTVAQTTSAHVFIISGEYFVS